LWQAWPSCSGLQTIEYLNYVFLRQCPGKHLHGVKPKCDYYRGVDSSERERIEAAKSDFQHIFLHENSDAMVFRMLSKFAESHIDGYKYQRATESTDETERKEHIDSAFERFDWLINCLNHIFEQFSVNQIVTRNGFVPRQDETPSAAPVRGA